jgi:C-terminal processing protease CtpA/Prc
VLRFVLAFALTIPLVGRAAALPAAAPADLTPAQAVGELRLLKRALVALHPGLYRYRTPRQVDAEFALAEAAVGQGASVATMYLQASRLAAAVQCGHTWANPLNQSEAVVQRLFRAKDKLPLRLRVVENRFLITASSDPHLRAGDELVAIDGRPASALIDELMPYLRADGSNDGKRRSQLDSGVNGGAMDRLFPLLHPPVGERYTLVYRRRSYRPGSPPASVSVETTRVADRESELAAAGQPEPAEAWTLDIDGPVATLTLPTFAFWRGGFDWKTFLDASFVELQRRGVTRLVLDLRRDEGGDSAVGDALLAHLLREPYTPAASRPEVSFERVPYALARYLDTWDFDFFDNTGHVQRADGRILRLVGSSEGGASIDPAVPAFRGRVVALVGPEMSSAGFLIARDLQRSHAAMLVGQATGGSRRAMNGGQLAWLTLPRSGVAVDIPLVSWVPDAPQPDQAVLPDIAVTESFEAAARGIDSDMRAGLAALNDAAVW